MTNWNQERDLLLRRARKHQRKAYLTYRELNEFLDRYEDDDWSDGDETP